MACGLFIFFLGYEQSSKLIVGVAVLVNTHTHTHTQLDIRVCARAHVCQLLLRPAPDTFRLLLFKHCIDLGKYIMPNNLQWRLTLSSVTLGFNSEITYSVCIWSRCRDSRSLLLHYFRLYVIKRNISLNYKNLYAFCGIKSVYGLFCGL